MKINNHYYNRYINYIKRIRDIEHDRELYYSEKHHIIPKCIGGSDDDFNLIKLSAKEHFIAHWMLWKAYPTNIKISFAFWSMCSQPSYGRNYFDKLSKCFKNSKIYERLKLEISLESSRFHTDKVYVYDPSLKEIVCLSKDEYKNSSLKFHTTGMVNVYDIETDEPVWIKSETYQANKDRYKTNLSKTKFTYIDDTGNEYKITKYEALNLKKSGKKLKQKSNPKIKIIDQYGNVSLIHHTLYDKDKHTHILKNKITVMDTTDNKIKTITINEYNSNPNRYITSTKGKVLAFDTETNEYKVIGKKEFENNKKYTGQTKGLTTVYNNKMKKYEQIKVENLDRDIHSGPCKGRKNIINMHTGIRSQINIIEFNPQIHLVLGDKRQYFKAIELLTKKEKNISIFEWKLVKHKYQIKDKIAFNKAKKFKKDVEWNQK